MKAMNKKELITVPLKKGAYERPERPNQNIPDRKYEKVDLACESSRIGNDGNVYMPEDSVPGLLDRKKKETRYIVDHKLPNDSTRTVNNQRLVNTSSLVGYMDQYSHLTRNAEEADLYRYGRESLTRIGDSDQAEAQRRRTDALVDRELPKLKKQRGSAVDEITGEPLEKYSAFHHINNKSIHNNPFDVIDPEQGINVNQKTHQEIHRRGIMDQDELDEQKESIRKAVTGKE